ncbi:glycosyltransferase [Methylomagnum sp.]
MAERWLFVDSVPVFGGHEVMLLRWMEELSRQDLVEPRLLARDGGRLCERGVAWAVPTCFPPIAPPRSIWAKAWTRLGGPVRDAAVFIRTVRRENPALCVVAEGSLLSQALFVVLARLLRRRVVVYVPLVDSFAAMGFRRARLKDGLVRWVYSKLPQGWITITAEQAHGFVIWAGVTRPIFTLPNTVAREVEEASVGRTSVRLVGLKPDLQQGAMSSGGSLRPYPKRMGETRGLEFKEAETLCVLVLGRLDAHHKGLDWLLDFLERAGPTPGIHINLVGDGPYAAEIDRRLQASPDLAGSLSRQGWSDPLPTMARHAVLLLTSRFEGVPLVMLEAMALGLPVVASDLPGTRAYLPKACLFPMGDIAAAFQILARLKSPETRRHLAEINRETFAALASNAAFAVAVAELARKLRGLAP